MLLDVLDQHAARSRLRARALVHAGRRARTGSRRTRRARYRRTAHSAAPILPSAWRALFRFHARRRLRAHRAARHRQPDAARARASREAFAALERCPARAVPRPRRRLQPDRPARAARSRCSRSSSRAPACSAPRSRARASSALACELLPAHHDVDTWDDLVRLGPELDPRCTPRTLRALRAARR